MSTHSDEDNTDAGHGDNAGHGIGGHGDEGGHASHDVDHGHDDHAEHSDVGHGANFANNTPEVSGQVMLNWWKFPFDPITNFSLLGYILGKIFDREKQDKKVDFTLSG